MVIYTRIPLAFHISLATPMVGDFRLSLIPFHQWTPDHKGVCFARKTIHCLYRHNPEQIESLFAIYNKFIYCHTISLFVNKLLIPMYECIPKCFSNFMYARYIKETSSVG